MEDNMMRHESVLILPKNTLRLTDVMLQMEIYNAENKLFQENFDDTVWKIVTRSNKDLSKYNKGVDKDLIDELYESKFADYYDLSPRTLMYEIITIMINQKFIRKSIVLFSNKDATDDTFEYDYYDGTIDSLEKYIIDNEITCIVFDDIELLKQLYDRKNISLERKTFILSRLGYNFYRDKTGKLKLKYYEDIYKDIPTIELTTIDLYNFPENVVNKFMPNKKEME